MNIMFLSLVALWCGNPAGYRLTSSEVNNCRKHIIDCYNKYQGHLIDSEVIIQCTSNEQLP